MILVDTSVWVDHLRSGNRRLQLLLADNLVSVHPFVMGELACGALRNRAEIHALLRDLPTAGLAEQDEVLQLIERERLYGRGIGWVDAHLLASALLEHSTLWTIDKRLLRIARSLGLAS